MPHLYPSALPLSALHPSALNAVAAIVFVLLGAAAGCGARALVRRLRRGAPVRPPWCEMTLAAIWGACGWWAATGRLSGEWLPLLLGLSWLGVAAGAVDLMRGRLPDALTLPALPSALLLVAPLGPACVTRAVAGASVLFGAHLLVRVTVPAAMGAGDVKLAASLGAALGAVSWPALLVWAVLAAVITGCITGYIASAAASSVRWAGGRTVREGRGAAVPHGPAMLAAGWLVVAGAALGAAGATAWVA
jgi:leader peptidase (prepilin peptidase)/N-methyltransferase